MSAEMETIRTLVDLRERQVQKARIQFGNRLDAIQRGVDQATPESRRMLEKYYDRFALLEEQLDSDIAVEARLHPMYPYITAVKGLGTGLAAKLLAMIPIERSPNVSDLWRYAGLAVIDGKAERRTKGEKSHFNSRLKVSLYNVALSMLKSKSPYAVVYYEAKAKYAEQHPDWTKAHCHLAALRVMEKLFLAHLWMVWRQVEGLPLGGPWVEVYGGHVDMSAPQQYGWPEVA